MGGSSKDVGRYTLRERSDARKLQHSVDTLFSSYSIDCCHRTLHHTANKAMLNTTPSLGGHGGRARME